MGDARYRLQGSDGGLHDARWSVRTSRDLTGIRLEPAKNLDMQDLAASVHTALLRLQQVSEAVTTQPNLDALANRYVAGGVCNSSLVTLGPTRRLSDPLSIHEVSRGLEEFARQLAEQPAELVLTISCALSHAVQDEADLVAVLLLRDIDAPIQRAKNGTTRRRPPEAPSLLPLMPVDAHLITCNDPRFAALVAPHADLRERIKAYPPSRWDRAHDVLAEVQYIRDGLEGATIEEEAASVLEGALGDRLAGTWTGPLGRRYGLDGRGAVTLDAVGREAGVTRERVRQIQGKIRLPVQPVWAPAMDAALTLIDHAVPCPIEELSASLRAAELTNVPSWQAEALRLAASVTGRALDLEEVDGFVGRPSELVGVTKVLPTARAESALDGIAHLAEIQSRLADGAHGIDSVLVRSVLQRANDVHWIGEDALWTDHAPGRNRLVNTSLRILSVIQPQTLEDMLEGVDRQFRWRIASGQGRMRDIQVPELSELASFYASHPAFSVASDGRIVAAEPVDMESLGPEKLAMVSVLLAQPHFVMDRNSLMDACREVGMKIATAGIYTTYGECIKNFGHNVWGIRGAVVTDEVIEATQHQARLTRKSFDRRRISGVTATGRPWTARVITPTFLNSGVMPFDWGQNVLADRKLVAIDMSDGETVGALRFVNAFNYGYTPFLGRHDVAVGDVIRVLADPGSDLCHIEVGGEELLGEPFDY